MTGPTVGRWALPTVHTQIVQLEDSLGLSHCGVQAGKGVGAAAGRGDGGGEAVLGGVIDDRADAPYPTAGSLELAEVGLPHPVAHGRRVVKHLGTQRRPRLAIRAKPRGSNSPRRRSARSTVKVDTAWPSARIIAAILR